MNIVQVLIVIFFASILTNCHKKDNKIHNEQQLEIEKPIYDTSIFNLKIYPDTNTKWSMFQNLGIAKRIFRQKVILDTNSMYYILINSENKERYWPENMPNILIKSKEFLVSGILYGVPGNEKMPGYPITLTEIIVNCIYKNADRK